MSSQTVLSADVALNILVFLTQLALRRSFICDSLTSKYDPDERYLLDCDSLKPDKFTDLSEERTAWVFTVEK